MNTTTPSDNRAAGHASAPAPTLPLMALALCTLLPALGTSVANIALPTLARAFDAPFGRVQWVVLAYLLTVTATLVGAGRLGDVLGRKRLMLAGIALLTLASAACSMATELSHVIVARMLQGLGASVMMALGLALVGDIVPAARTGRAMGMLGSTSAAGTALGPTLGGILITNVGWPAIFAANVPLGIATLALAARYLPADPRQRPAPARLRPWSMLREPDLRDGLATNVLVSAVMMATLVIGPFHLAGALAQDAVTIGLAMSVGPVVAALAGVPAGRLVERLGTGPARWRGLSGMLAGCVAVCLVPLAMGVPGYVLGIAVLTAGYALYQAANNAAVMAGAGQAHKGVVSGLLNLSRHAGFVAGSALLGGVFALAAGGHDIAGAHRELVAEGTRAAFAVAACLLVLALLLVRHRRDRTTVMHNDAAGMGGAAARAGGGATEAGT